MILGEETFLRERFPDFTEYSRTVPRLLPRISPPTVVSTINTPGTFSWDLYFKHREYNAAIGFFAMTVALIAKLFWLSR